VTGYLMKKFHLVDFAAHYQKGFRNHVVPIGEVPALMETFDHYGCYATYFFYSDEVLTHMSSHGADSAPTIAGFTGKVWAPFFPIDMDDPDLSIVLQATRSVVSLFLDAWEMDPNGLHVYFSGSKGFHIMLDARLFGKIVPSKSLPVLFAAMRQHLALELAGRERETVDMGIKDRVRLLRLPNTVHEKSGLYKVSLPLDVLFSITPGGIKRYARSPHPLDATDATGLLSAAQIKENPAAVRLFRRVRRQMGAFPRKPFVYRLRRTDDPSATGFRCMGIQKIWESHVEPGNRNNCAIRLASEFRLSGLTETETRARLLRWNEQYAIALPAWELDSVVRSAFQHPFPYRYGCRDEILRSFCPLEDLEACRRHVAGRRRDEATEDHPPSREKGNPRAEASG